jgi:hypothetical protein
VTKPANKRLNRVVYGVFITIAAVFIVSSTIQVASAVFRSPLEAPKVGAPCGAYIAALIAGVDAAIEAAASAADGEEAKKRYLESRRIVDRQASGERTCAEDPHGGEALAAVARYDRAAETFAARRGTELSPVRLRAQSFIRQDR